MDKELNFDLEIAHRYFSADCFNKAWDYMEKTARTSQDDLAMLHASLASLWHWSQRSECTDENLSVGFWQVSRVYALLGQAENARIYGELALTAGEGAQVPPYCLGYAHEALARAAMLAGDQGVMHSHLDAARNVSGKMTDEEGKRNLLADLETIKL